VLDTGNIDNMKEEKKESIMKEALVEYNSIMEAADTNAKKKLAEEFPEKFQNLLKEEIQNNKKSKKESDKKDKIEESNQVDGIKSNKESDMKNQKKETKKVVNEGDESQPFKEKPKNIEVVTEERDKDFMGDVEGDTPNMADGQTEDGDTFVDGITTDKDSMAQKTSATTPDSKPIVKETFDVSELDVSSVGTAIEEANDEDEVITINELGQAISEMQGDEEKPKSSGGNGGDAFQELVNMRNKLNEMIGGMDEQKRHGGKGANRVNPGGPTESMIEEETEVGMEDELVDMEEQKKHGGKGANRVNPGGPTQQMIDEEEITDADVEAVLGAPEGGAEEMEESLNQPISHGNSRQAGTKGLNQQQRANMRFAERPSSMNEAKLIAENKKLTKKVNESKKLTALVENYKSVLQKYRNQLKEMAVFNSNLAHVNNLLVNESLALTQEDKIKIINEFKQVDTIADSQMKYKTFLTEMKEGKKTLAESVEAKAGNSVAPSSKQKLDEVVESTAYENNEHVKKMLNIMEYMDTRGEKKIIK